LTPARFVPDMRPMRLPPLDSPQWNSSLRAFAWDMSATSATILSLVTYIGIGALAHDTRFSLGFADEQRSRRPRQRRGFRL